MNIPKAHSTNAEQVLQRENAGPVAILTLNRPTVRNSLSVALLASLTDAFEAIAPDRSIRAVIIAANGPAYCAGHDLRELTERRGDADGGRAFYRETMATCSKVMQQIVNLPQPTIAAVQGTASAAGCQLVASCDLAIASTSAKFITPGVDIGLFCSTPMVALSRNISRKHTMEMLLTGEAVTAERAAAIGLVNSVVSPGQERSKALEFANLIASKSPHALHIGKAAFYRQLDMPLVEAYRYACEVMTENMMERDASEGISAFIEKRKPNWEDLQ